MFPGLIARGARAAVGLLLLVGPASAQSVKLYRHIVFGGHEVKWGNPVGGTGAVVSFATVATETRFPAVRNCGGVAPLDALLAANRISRSVFDRELDAAFAAWSAVADISFTPALSPADADILIGAEIEPLGRAFTNVEYGDAGSRPGPERLTRALICLNPEKAWKVGFDGNLDVYDIRYALMHEIGHAIGLDHPGVTDQLMDFHYRETFRCPQAGDILGAVALYGQSKAAIAAAPDTGGVRPVSDVRRGAAESGE